MSNPTTSLIIATYNRGPGIAPTLDSVFAQAVIPDEVLVVDDGSTDRTGEWIRTNYPRARVVSKANGGTSSARNFGAQAVRGEFLVFLDHDDTLKPHGVETLLELFRTYPEAQAVFADHEYRNLVTGVQFGDHHAEQPAFHRMRAIPVERRVGPSRLYGRAMYYSLLKGNLLQQPWAIHRAAFLALGGFAPDVRYCEDWDMYLRVARTLPLAVTDRVISTHNVEGLNLHLSAGQEEMHQKVIRRQLNSLGWIDTRAALVLRRRLAMYLKGSGDSVRATRPRTAWSCYVRSLALWPFDHVVAARVLLWLPAVASTPEMVKADHLPE